MRRNTMTRWIAAVACTLAFALAVPLGSEAEAAYSRKKCIAPAMLGAGQTTWICRASQRCCYDWLTRRGTCTSRCF
jgi:hypothetical protein